MSIHFICMKKETVIGYSPSFLVISTSEFEVKIYQTSRKNLNANLTSNYTINQDSNSKNPFEVHIVCHF